MLRNPSGNMVKEIYQDWILSQINEYNDFYILYDKGDQKTSPMSYKYKINYQSAHKTIVNEFLIIS